MGALEEKMIYQLNIDGAALWEGCILASCVHACMLPEYPFILDENKWSGGIYISQCEDGNKAALVFTSENELMFGMFCDFKSPRTELVLSGQYAQSHYRGAPEYIQEMAQALSELFEAMSGEKELPFVTTGFWAEDGKVFSHDSQEDWFRHGGHIVEAQMMAFEEAMSYYRVKRSMDARRVEIAKRICRERIQSPAGAAALTREEVGVLAASGPYNIGACEEVFGQFGVVFGDNA